MASFSGEFLNMPIVDSNGDLLGHLKDLVLDSRSGQLVEFLVKVSTELDASKLPWPTNDGLCHIPAEEIGKISGRIHLKR
ncbi:MAG: PRC-barrel domain-containing protein [Candidatus Poseidoniales archaeon]|jgi:sporulation protein YlmC with PRC-barrel domain